MEDEPKHYVVGHIREALAQDPRVNEMTIHVAVAGKKVFLTGAVATKERQEAIGTVVREVVPDLEVYNETTVESYPEADTPEPLS